MKKYIVLSLTASVCISVAAWHVSRSRTFQFFGEIYPNVHTNEKVVALTFDDGPTEITDSILPILNELDIKATFFVTGKSLFENRSHGQKVV